MAEELLPHDQSGVITDKTGTPDASTALALDRTLLAQERTLMAWTRTAVSLISFGFTIYTFFENFGTRHASARLFGTFHYSLLMISMGLICLLLATIRNWRDSRRMEDQYGVKPRRLAPAMATLVACLGLFGLLAVVLR
jgi:putative membrane protein